MKTIITILIAFLATCIAIARQSFLFPGWDRLEETSPDIIIAHCGKNTPPTPGVYVMNATKSDSAIEIVSVLKGTNTMSSSRLSTDHELLEGENYLVFGGYNRESYQAFEEYRVIPLGNDFSTNAIAGKPLDEQIQTLFKRRLDNLKRQIQAEQEEKQRLEEGLKI